ncbi:hypothetical protein DK870_13895 [Pseudomonas sp. Q1]|nr:hypothetical protein [Pseudomonas sp. Q1]
MWERACSRIRYASHRMHRLIHRFREQARSHTFDHHPYQKAQRPPEGGLCLVKRQLNEKLT